MTEAWTQSLPVHEQSLAINYAPKTSPITKRLWIRAEREMEKKIEKGSEKRERESENRERERKSEKMSEWHRVSI